MHYKSSKGDFRLMILLNTGDFFLPWLFFIRFNGGLLFRYMPNSIEIKLHGTYTHQMTVMHDITNEVCMKIFSSSYCLQVVSIGS